MTSSHNRIIVICWYIYKPVDFIDYGRVVEHVVSENDRITVAPITELRKRHRFFLGSVLGASEILRSSFIHSSKCHNNVIVSYIDTDIVCATLVSARAATEKNQSA